MTDVPGGGVPDGPDRSKSIEEILADAARRGRTESAPRARPISSPIAEPLDESIEKIMERAALQARLERRVSAQAAPVSRPAVPAPVSLAAVEPEAVAAPRPLPESPAGREGPRPSMRTPVRVAVALLLLACAGLAITRFHGGHAPAVSASATLLLTKTKMKTASTELLATSTIRPPPAVAQAPVTPTATSSPIALAAPAIPEPTSPSPSRPPVGLVAERSDASAVWVAEVLAPVPSSGGASGWIDRVPADDWEASLAALKTQPRVTVIRYDALQAARVAPAASRLPRLEVIAPLATEPILFVVRADSPLRYVHEIAGKAINLGSPRSARALTARTVYREMFGRAPHAGGVADLDEDVALQRLSADRSIDVVVLVGLTPNSALTPYLPVGAHGVRLLDLDRTRPETQKVSAHFIPVNLRDARLDGSEGAPRSALAVMTFLVTAAAPATGASAHDAAMTEFAQALCTQLPRMTRNAEDGWNRVPPTLQLDVGWPYSATAQSALANCGRGSAPRPGSQSS